MINQTSHTRTGNVMMSVLAATIALGVVLAVSKFSQMAGSQRQALVNENSSRLVNEMVTSRIGQAIASTAILCSEVKKSCFWNDQLANAKPADFQFKSVRNDGSLLKIDVTSCLPSYTHEATFENCKTVDSSVVVQFSDIAELKKANLVYGDQSESDQDSYAAVVTVSSSYLEASGKSRDYTSSSVIRRPRPYLRVEPLAGSCKQTCAVSSGNKSQDFCYGKLRIFNNSNGQDLTTSKVKYTIYNDGPGHLYRFQIKRSFTPNPSINASTETLPPSVVYDSMNDTRINGKGPSKKMGLAAGESLEISDDSLPCYDEKTYQTIVNVSTRQGGFHDGNATGQIMGAYESASSSTRELASNSRPSGQAEYTFASVEPANALMLGQGGASVPATQTLTTTIRNVVYVINTGMN